MPDLFLDIETYSSVDLKKYGVYRYAEDRDFQILMCGWHRSDDARAPVRMAYGHKVNEIPGLFDPAVRKVAHNAAFERVCFSRWIGLDRDTFLDPEEWHDTMAVAAEYGWPQKLEALAAALGAPAKDSAGTALIRWFCKPAPNGKRRLPEDHPEKWAQFVAYCQQDVRALIGVHVDLGEFPTEAERRLYVVDQRINDRGMAVDLGLARAGVQAAADNKAEQEAEFRRLTGVSNPNSGPQVLAWGRAEGLKLPDLQAATIEKLLDGELPVNARRVLELRQELALVAYKKFETTLGAVTTGDRLRGGFRFFGAHTGRWAGRGVQPHNLPRHTLDSPALIAAAILDLHLGLGAEAHTLKALVRPMFTGPLTVVDYAAIEARVIAWLASEQWALEAFRNGRDIYVETAERMGGLTRAQGKVAVLALGFQGAVNSLRVMGAQDTDDVLKVMVAQWRTANPSIVNMWHDLGQAFRHGGKVGEHLEVVTDGKDRHLVLPSKRAIGYHQVGFRTEEGPYGPRTRASFALAGRPGLRQDTYGGRLAENATQAMARDILGEALVRLDENGYSVVGHVHDEVIVEGTDVPGVTGLMCQVPAWAAGLPIDGEGFTCDRYRKG